MIVTLVNRKGGTGKTTSCGYIAQVFHAAGHSVLGVDLDDERSWKKWSETGSLPYTVEAFDKRGDLRKRIEQHKGIVVIDTPPNDEAVIYKVAMMSDEIIVPLSATAFDVNRLFSTMSTIEDVEEARNKPLASVFFTRWQGQHLLSKEINDALAERERKVPLLDARVRLLTRYAGFGTPTYLDEYQAVLKEAGIFDA